MTDLMKRGFEERWLDVVLVSTCPCLFPLIACLLRSRVPLPQDQEGGKSGLTFTPQSSFPMGQCNSTGQVPLGGNAYWPSTVECKYQYRTGSTQLLCIEHVSVAPASTAPTTAHLATLCDAPSFLFHLLRRVTLCVCVWHNSQRVPVQPDSSATRLRRSPLLSLEIVA